VGAEIKHRPVLFDEFDDGLVITVLHRLPITLIHLWFQRGPNRHERPAAVRPVRVMTSQSAAGHHLAALPVATTPVNAVIHRAVLFERADAWLVQQAIDERERGPPHEHRRDDLRDGFVIADGVGIWTRKHHYVELETHHHVHPDLATKPGVFNILVEWPSPVC